MITNSKYSLDKKSLEFAFNEHLKIGSIKNVIDADNNVIVVNEVDGNKWLCYIDKKMWSLTYAAQVVKTKTRGNVKMCWFRTADYYIANSRNRSN